MREIFEKGLSFSDYIREYDLQRGEGVLLRTINDVYKVLVKTVPVSFKNEDLLEIETELALMIRSVDSSLLDEWTRLKSDFVELGGQVRVEGGEAKADSSTSAVATTAAAADAAPQSFDLRAVTRRLRVEFQRLTRALAAQDVEEAGFLLAEWQEWNELKPVRCQITDDPGAELLEIANLPPSFFGDALLKMKALGFRGIRTDLPSRSPGLMQVSREANVVRVQNRLLDQEDPELSIDVVAEFEIRSVK